MYGGSTTEEQRQANEVRRLKRELTEAREQVMSLSSQLSTNVSTWKLFAIQFCFNKQFLIDSTWMSLCCFHVVFSDANMN